MQLPAILEAFWLVAVGTRAEADTGKAVGILLAKTFLHKKKT